MSKNDSLLENITAAFREHNKLYRENKHLRGALKFYAEQRYKIGMIFNGEMTYDDGLIARKALKGEL